MEHVMNKGEVGAGPGSNQAGQTTKAFLEQIHNAGLLRSAAVATDVAAAVFSTLLMTVSRNQAQRFLSALPATLRDLLHASAVGRREAAEISGREEVLRTIADRLRIELEGAEVAARIVLAAAENWLPRKELELLRLELPWELRDLWAPPRTPRRP
jgi:uncharacterized protein (DUF2267 family)